MEVTFLRHGGALTFLDPPHRPPESCCQTHSFPFWVKHWGFQSDNITITKLHEKVLGKTMSQTYKFQILRNALKTLQTSREERNWRNMTRKLSKNYKLTSYFFYFFSSPLSLCLFP